ncbi:hypothetical protein N7495_000263 [Penicillium taxi]|uniref:uncharacterized protein n=1 Tax=Penicillium taxi TaxID=168475 RepID=UPI002545281C|nr:uncharacterized protein N7495_000263 [Penicillium taxi]KAJ5907581.1 hypothetical protein N7495_000263 [Penicillium taxi]
MSTSDIPEAERELLEQPDLEKQSTLGITEDTIATIPKYPVTDISLGIVGWESQHDPENPQNFATSKKWALLGLISAFTFISPLASSMFSPAITIVAEDFHETNETVIAFSVSIFLLGYTLYGRRIVLSAANWFFIMWQIGCALSKNIETLIVCRLFAGIGGSACLTIGAGVVADLFPREMRARATAVWSMGPLMGPVVGPIAGGFLGENVSWRWIFWVILIASFTMQIGIEVLNKETYAPILIKWKTAKLAKDLGRSDLHSAYELNREPASDCHHLKQSLVRPAKLFLQSPIIVYGFSIGLSGLAYLGIGLGFGLGLVLVALTNDQIVSKLTTQNNGKFEPEMRLPTMIVFACILPISFFWYGWSADKHVHWIVPIIGMFPFGVGMMGVFMPIQTYIIDCYPAYAASANAALTASRSLVGAVCCFQFLYSASY